MKRKKIGMPRLAPMYFNNGDGEGGEGGGGGEGGQGGEGKFTQADLDKAIQAAVSKLETKNGELLSELKNAKGSLKNWEGLDPEKVRSTMEKLEKDEVLRLHAEGKHDEAYNKMMEKERSTWESKIDGLNKELESYKGKSTSLEQQVRDLIIDQQVITSFMQEKGFESAAPDVVNRAKSVFKIEDGQAIARNKDGQIIRGANGPITIPEWVAQLKTDAPHLFPGSRGAGASGAGGGGGSDIDARMKEAADAGDMATYKKLKAERDKVKEA